MIFGPVPVADAAGRILAHSLKVGQRRLRKGAVLSAEDVRALQDAGYGEVIVASLQHGDIDENTAASRIAAALLADPQNAGLRVDAPFTGRVNLIADGPGVAIVDPAAIGAVNRVDPAITLATVARFQQVAPGGMVATIKVIPYGVADARVAAAESAARSGDGAPIRLAPPAYQTAGLVMTVQAGGPDNAKGQAVIDARLRALGLTLAQVVEVPHRAADVTRALSLIDGDLVLILTASATSDIADVAPEAVRAAGGRIERFGMPVDPGNLLFLGCLGTRPVIGLPGCARSPVLNGADWVLSRVACGIEVTGDDIAAMGVGGLLKEIPTRPQPRAGRPRDTR
ncbi:MAG: molybdopterin-binding protein [Marinibacterium sp.]